jgi:hypothetical protein
MPGGGLYSLYHHKPGPNRPMPKIIRIRIRKITKPKFPV